MVEIEEEYAGRYGLWMDGNETNASVVQALTMQPQMDELGISEELRAKHQLLNYRARKKMGKAKLWCSLLAAQVEQELINVGEAPEEFDGFLLKPQSAIPNSPNNLLVKGVTPTNDRRRITYAQITLLCQPSQSKAAKASLRSVIDNLDFNLSEPIDYDDYRGFEKQCRQFLRYMIEMSRDKEAYRKVSQQTGITFYKILP